MKSQIKHFEDKNRILEQLRQATIPNIDGQQNESQSLEEIVNNLMAQLDDALKVNLRTQIELEKSRSTDQQRVKQSVSNLSKELSSKAVEDFSKNILTQSRSELIAIIGYLRSELEKENNTKDLVEKNDVPITQTKYMELVYENRKLKREQREWTEKEKGLANIVTGSSK